LGQPAGDGGTMSAAPAYRIDGELVPRSRFYAVACDPRRSAVVEACAGAGKTWMLVSRILRALLDGAEPHEILAITFTRKAAGEMRARLADWLAEFGDPRTSDEQRARALIERGVDASRLAELVPRLARLQLDVLVAGRPVQVHTFHAWFSQLLRSAPLELLASLGLQPGMDLIESIDDLEGELFRRFHARVLRDDALRQDFARVVLDRGRARLRKWLLTALDKRLEIELADHAGTLDDSVPPIDLGGFAHPAEALQSAAWREALRELALQLGLGGVKAQDAATGLVMALEAGDANAMFEAAWSTLFTHAGTPRKQLGKSETLTVVQQRLARLAELIQAHEAHLEHRRLVRLGRVLLADYAALKRSRRLLDMADLERCALELLRDSQLAAWVQERLDARVRHLLIDEFQDTSPLQWQALHAWLSGYAGAGGGASGQRPPAVFIVGDPKQSIYRFRRAEPRVFAAARDFVCEGLDGAALACDHTRRNRPEVLAAVNAVFTDAAAHGLYPGFRPHTSEEPALGIEAVLALPGAMRPPRESAARDAAPPELIWRDSLTVPRHEPEEVLREQEAATVADAIAELIDCQGFAPGDVMVLSRKRASLRLLAAALQQRHLPYVAAEETPLLESPEVRDLLALLDVLASPQHRLSLAHALRSPIFGAADDELVLLAERARALDSGDWWRSLQRWPPAEMPARLQRASELLARWHEAALRLPPHDLLDRVVAEGEVHARVAAAVPPERRRGALAAIDALLGQALALDGGRYASPYSFVRALRRRALEMAAPAQADAVQLLTIHGAKGLEARAVFVMDADPEAQKDDTATLLIDWPVEAAAPLTCAFIASQARVPAALAPLMAAERAAGQREELNGLYVAMTRARERLVFSHTEPHRRGEGPSWRRRVEPAVVDWLPRPAPGESRGGEATLSLPALPHWQLPEVLARPAGQAGSADTAATRLGQAVHRVLEWSCIGAEPGDLRAAAAQAAREFALDAGRSADVARFVASILRSPACADFFEPAALSWAGNEVAIAVAGEVRRIDRLVQLRSGDWWVLDYKLSPAPQRDAANLAQLQAYRQAVLALQPGSSVRAAFITGSGEVIEPEPPGAADRTEQEHTTLQGAPAPE